MFNIIFYFPYKGIGGVSLLFLRLSKYLANDYNVFLVDFRDGCMGRETPNGVNFIDIESVTRYPDNSVLVLQSLAPWNIRDIAKFPPDTRVIFWNLHPQNLYPNILSTYSSSRINRIVANLLKSLSLLRRHKLAKVVEYLTTRQALVFMDNENYIRTQQYYPKSTLVKDIVPILSPVSRICKSELRSILRCCWVGRIVDFKIHILSHLIRRLDSAVANVGPIEMTIVGEGDALEQLQSQISHLNRVQVLFRSEMSPNILDEYLDSQVDILFAMGTSALEGASRAIPTFLLDYSYVPVYGLYKFKYIYESENYSLAELIDGELFFEMRSTLEAKLIDIKRFSNGIGQECHDYWQKFYSPDIVSHTFLKYVKSSTATIADFLSLDFNKPDLISLAVRSLLRQARGCNELSGFYDN